jgi:hypothetical protein
MLRSIAVVLSLVPTPLLVFISSSSALYIQNQSELHYRVDVLRPFVLVAAVVFGIGLALYALSRHAPVRVALCLYYAAGPLYIIFAYLRHRQDEISFLSPLYETRVGLLVWPVTLLVIAAAMAVRFEPRKLKDAFALLGALLLVIETAGFSTKAVFPTTRGTSVTDAMAVWEDAPATAPNIYHLVMDGFQTDFFEAARTPEIDEALDGFTFYPQNTSIYHSTTMSLTSVLLGRKYAYDRTRWDFVNQAFSARTSFLYWLRALGYKTVAVVPGRRTQEGREPTGTHRDLSLLDYVVHFDDLVKNDLGDLIQNSFRNLWLYSTLPGPVREKVAERGWFTGMDREDLRLLENRRLLPRSAQVLSHRGFEAFMREEKGLPQQGRYTYIHLLLPHWPFNLRADCSFQEGGGKTSPVEQTQCALALVAKFVTTLRKLGRFEDSLILIHGDHGGFFRTHKGSLMPYERSRSLRALLMIKPLGVVTTDGLIQSDRETTLLDIKPALMNAVNRARLNDSHLESPREALAPYGGVVPFVEGETLETAKLILGRRGFTLGNIVEVHHPTYAANRIIAHAPSPYADAPDGNQVQVLLSLGPRDHTKVMPDFIGREIDDVLPAIIDRARDGTMSNTQIHYVEQVGFPRGRVVAQSPKAGDRIDTEVEISLYVSKGS